MSDQTSALQHAIDVVEALPVDAQATLIEIIQQRLQQQRRNDLYQNVLESERDYAQGQFSRGTVSDLMAELDNE